MANRFTEALSETVAVPLPRPKGEDGMRRAKLAVPHLMAIHGVCVACYGVEIPQTKDVKGWRLYVAVDGDVLLDGAPLQAVLKHYGAHGALPFRDAGKDVCILTPRDAPVEVAVAVEWHGKGKAKRLPAGLEVRIRGLY